MIPSKFDIYYAKVYFEDAADMKVRPVCVCQVAGNEVVVWKITKNTNTRIVHYEIEDRRSAGLKFDSVIDIKHVYKLRSDQLVSHVGELSTVDRICLSLFMLSYTNPRVVDQTELEGIKMERNKELQEACQEAKIRYMSKKLKESFEDEHVGKEVKELEETPNTPDTPDEFSAATIINNLIQDEWQAIQGYNDAVATFASMGVDENIINIFKDIVNEEHVHVGQLQKALESVSPNVQSIQDGEKEGSEQLEVPVQDGDIKNDV